MKHAFDTYSPGCWRSGTVVFFILSIVFASAQKAPEIQTRLTIAQVRDTTKRAYHYHALNAEVKLAQARLVAFMSVWSEECTAKGQTLQMGQDGDPGCAAPTPATAGDKPKSQELPNTAPLPKDR